MPKDIYKIMKQSLTKSSNVRRTKTEKPFTPSRPSVLAREEAAYKRTRVEAWVKHHSAHLLILLVGLVAGAYLGWFLCTEARADADQHALSVTQVKKFEK